MAVTELAAGSETISTTEWSLTTDTAGPDADTTDGEFQCFIDLNAIAAGDVFQFRAYEKVQSSDTQRRFLEATFAGAQGTPNWVSPKFMLMHGWDFTLIKLAGTDRTLTWSIREVNPVDAAELSAALGALNDISPAQVNAEVVDVVNVDTFGEPTGVPGATVTLVEKIGRLYMVLRNGLTVSATKKQFLDDGGAAEWEKDLSDDGSTYTESEGNAP